jgi:hypothetical protein
MLFTTILDYKQAGERLGKSWTGYYLQTGCPYVECCRWIAYVLHFGRVTILSDLFAYVMFAPLFVAVTLLPFLLWHSAHGFFSHLWWLIRDGAVALAGHGSVITLFHGPLNFVGEKLHGDPLGPGGALYVDPSLPPPAKKPKPATKVDAVVGAIVDAIAGTGSKGGAG